MAFAHDAVRLAFDCVLARRRLLHSPDKVITRAEAEPACNFVRIHAAFDGVDRELAAWQRLEHALAVALDQHIF